MRDLYWAKSHDGSCCESCLQDWMEGYGGDLEGCCCRALTEMPTISELEARMQDEALPGGDHV
jgi:hypothetical protein